ncbi:MAG: iron-containing alcohol dehydrogenase [Bacteroidales bacterium]|nr:iron-containing alcohol dehydrogenase [Bacteroidales bacterium]MCF8402592.1 iron-containing alcohol dehydrogenase [Bacteroidales bacterium]
MQNFKIENPTIVHFGNDVINDLGKVVSNYGKNVLLVYGKGSIKKNGIYNAVIHQLNSIKANVIECKGIKPNPLIMDVNNAVSLGREKQVEVVLAVGGGSVIDSAKLIALGISSGGDVWDFMENKRKPTAAVPIISVLTLAATGSEMNQFAVVQNPQLKKKLGFRHKLMYPQHSFLDPSYTFSVSKAYTAYGIADLIAHALENYFGKGEATLSDRFVYSIIKEAMDYGPALLNNLGDYELRAKIMYAATMALNGLTSNGREFGEWGVHSIGHILSLLYDTAHGATLSIAYPAWLKLMTERIPERISELGKALFDQSDPEKTILEIENFFRKIECPVRMSEIGIDGSKKSEIIQLMIQNKVGGMHYSLKDKDVKRIVEYMFEG